MQGVARLTAEESPLGCYVKLQEAERRNQEEISRPTHGIARAEAHDSRNGFSAVFRTSPVEWNAWGRPGQRGATKMSAFGENHAPGACEPSRGCGDGRRMSLQVRDSSQVTVPC